jgi:hypothetical protein
MKFSVEMDVEVADHDADIMSEFPEAVQQRFDGTAIRINRILVSKNDTIPAKTSRRSLWGT